MPQHHLFPSQCFFTSFLFSFHWFLQNTYKKLIMNRDRDLRVTRSMGLSGQQVCCNPNLALPKLELHTETNNHLSRKEGKNVPILFLAPIRHLLRSDQWHSRLKNGKLRTSRDFAVIHTRTYTSFSIRARTVCRVQLRESSSHWLTNKEI